MPPMCTCVSVTVTHGDNGIMATTSITMVAVLKPDGRTTKRTCARAGEMVGEGDIRLTVGKTEGLGAVDEGQRGLVSLVGINIPNSHFRATSWLSPREVRERKQEECQD